MSTPSDIPNLHDAVLESIEVRWDAGEADISLTRVPGGPLLLKARGLRRFVLSHEQEWGPSIYVNHATVASDERGRAVMEIEMQSGDTISVIADHVTPSQG